MGLRSRKRRLAAGVDNKVPTDLEGNCALQSTLEGIFFLKCFFIALD